MTEGTMSPLFVSEPSLVSTQPGTLDGVRLILHTDFADRLTEGQQAASIVAMLLAAKLLASAIPTPLGYRQGSVPIRRLWDAPKALVCVDARLTGATVGAALGADFATCSLPD